MKWAICMITLNGGEYLWYALKSVYDFIKEREGRIIIVEGSTKYARMVSPDGNSIDNTQDIIEGFKADSEEGFIIYRKVGKVENKQALRNTYFEILRGLPKEEQPDWILMCFKGETLIETEENGAKKIRDIKEGESVLTHTGQYQPVIKTFKRLYNQRKPLIQINNHIKCTPEHPFYVYRNGFYHWIKAKELLKSDFLTYPRKRRFDDEDYINFDCEMRGKDKNGGNNGSYKNKGYMGHMLVDRELARFFGLYLAEGCTSNDGIRLTFNNSEKEYIDFIKQICMTKFGRKPTIYSRWATTVKLNIQSLSKRFKEWFGDNAKNKKIPDFVKHWTLDNKLAFILGYIQGDGTSANTTKVCYSASKELIDGMYDLSIKNGLKVKKYPYVKPRKSQLYKGRIIKGSGTYPIGFSKESYNHLLDIFHSIDHEDYYLIPLKNIEQKKMGSEDPHIYNLEIKKDNSYIAGGVCVHNCDDDELYKIEDLRRLDKFLSENPKIEYVFNPQRWFWGDFKHVATTSETACLEQIKEGKRKDKIFYDTVGNRLRQGQYHERIFKWNPDIQHKSHSVITDGENRDVYIDPFYEDKRIVFSGCPRYHYGYMTTLKKMYERYRYYEERDQGKISAKLTDVWKDNYGYYLLYDVPLNTTTRVENYFGDHPEIIKQHPYWEKGMCPMKEAAKKDFKDNFSWLIDQYDLDGKYVILYRHKIALSRIKPLNEKTVLPMRILDVGGKGKFAKRLAQEGHNVTVINLNKSEIRALSEPSMMFHTNICDIFDFKKDDNDVYHYINCSETLEHIEKQQEAVNIMYRLLKKDGGFFGTVPEKGVYHHDDEKGIFFLDIEGIRKILETAGFKDIEVKMVASMRPTDERHNIWWWAVK